MSKAAKTKRRRVLVVTGSRAEFGLLRPVMNAIRKRGSLELRVCVAGEHLLGPAQTWQEVAKDYRIDAKVAMQRAGDRGRVDHAAAMGRGVTGFAAAYKKLKPDWVVVLGDRIEAFAAASAASIAGIAVCHIHGGDRAEGIADEAMRHAITKMAHLHCAATELSAKRIVRMGERKECVHVTGSPAIDGLAEIPVMNDSLAREFGDPHFVVLLHPSGTLADASATLNPQALSALGITLPRVAPLKASTKPEGAYAFFVYGATCCLKDDPRTGAGPVGLFLKPNFDPGREEILEQWQRWSKIRDWRVVDHMPREHFIGLLKRMVRRKRGLLVGNSSAGLIECAALGVPVLNVGSRQAGRERASNVVDADPLDTYGVRRLIRKADALAGHLRPSRMFGDGRTGPRIASLLETVDPNKSGLIRKRNAF